MGEKEKRGQEPVEMQPLKFPPATHSSNAQDCHQRLTSAFDFLFILLCFLTLTLTLTPSPTIHCWQTLTCGERGQSYDLTVFYVN